MIASNGNLGAANCCTSPVRKTSTGHKKERIYYVIRVHRTVHYDSTLDIEITGVLKDAGPGIISEVYRYIPIRHIQRITFPDCQIEKAKLEYGKTSFRKSLMNAKGRNVNMLLGKNTRLYGYIVSIMNNYFVFFSPIYKTVFISMDHEKSITFDEGVSTFNTHTVKNVRGAAGKN